MTLAGMMGLFLSGAAAGLLIFAIALWGIQRMGEEGITSWKVGWDHALHGNTYCLHLICFPEAYPRSLATVLMRRTSGPWLSTGTRPGGASPQSSAPAMTILRQRRR